MLPSLVQLLTPPPGGKACLAFPGSAVWWVLSWAVGAERGGSGCCRGWWPALKGFGRSWRRITWALPALRPTGGTPLLQLLKHPLFTTGLVKMLLCRITFYEPPGEQRNRLNPKSQPHTCSDQDFRTSLRPLLHSCVCSPVLSLMADAPQL